MLVVLSLISDLFGPILMSDPSFEMGRYQASLGNLNRFRTNTAVTTAGRESERGGREIDRYTGRGICQPPSDDCAKTERGAGESERKRE